MSERRCKFKYKTGSICGRKLAELNKSDQCYCHSYPEEETEMRGTCDNCKRPDLAIQKRGVYGALCASCGAAIAGLSGDDAVQALAEARIRLQAKGVRKVKPRKEPEQKKPAILTADEAVKKAEAEVNGRPKPNDALVIRLMVGDKEIMRAEIGRA